MNRADAQAELERIVPTTSDPVLTVADINACLDAARVVDTGGLGPAEVGYVETIDVDYAVAEAFELKALRAGSVPWVKRFTSEGSTFERVAADFAGLARRYRDRSTVGSGVGGISVIELHPQSPDGLLPRSARVDGH